MRGYRGYRGYGGMEIPPIAIGLGVLALLLLMVKPAVAAGESLVGTVFSWLKAQQWIPLNPPLRGTPGNRSPGQYVAVAKQFDVANATRYQPPPKPSTATWCNIFVWDVTRAMGVEIPHFWTGAENRAEMRANDIYRWLDMGTDGWRKTDPTSARSAAAQGIPVVLAWPNPGGTGHVAMLLPDGTIAQAGRTNLFGAPVGSGFGSHVPSYFVAPG